MAHDVVPPSATERFCQLAIEVSPDYAIVLDRDLRILYANPTASRSFAAVFPAGLAGRPLSEVFPPAISTRLEANLERIFTARTPAYIEGPFEIGPQRIWLGTWLTPVANEAGDYDRIVVLSRDITARKRTEETLAEREELYRTLVETSPDAVVLAGLDARLLAVNPQTVRLYGYDSAEELLASGRTGLDLVAEDDRARAQATLQGLLADETAAGVRFRFERKDGSLFWGEASASLVRDSRGEPSALIVVLRDVSGLVASEQELARRTARIESANRELERLHRERDQFLAEIGHAVRTPLVTGLGYLELLDDGDLGPLSDEAREAVEVARRNLQRLARIVDRGLSYQSMAQAATFAEAERRPLDLVQLAREAIADLGVRRPGTAIEVEAGDELPFDGDAELLRQAIADLLDNAVDHADATRVILALAPTADGGARIEVRDDGCGLPDEVARRLFQPFNRPRGGSCAAGLGLAVVHRIARAHGGDLTIESSGVGTRAVLSLACSSAVVD